jgi:DNA replication protein DnaC
MGQTTPLTLNDGDPLPVCRHCGEPLLEEKRRFSLPGDEYGTIVWRCHRRECEIKNDAELDRLYEESRQKQIEQERQAALDSFLADPIPVLAGYGVPPACRGASFESYCGGDKYVDALRRYLQSPDKSILLTGTCGSGKTHLAVSLLRELHIRGHQRLLYRNVPELLFAIRASFNGGEQSEWAIVEECTGAEYLLLDDLGAEKSTEYSIGVLYMIINHRLSHNLPTIVTSNLSLAQIESKLDARIASRLSEYMVVVLRMPDYRKQRRA